jgi:CheY-like chemotaxis protein
MATRRVATQPDSGMRRTVGMGQEPAGVLIVEDEFLVALDLDDIISAAGFRVVGIAADATGVETLSQEPRLALVDLNLRDGPTAVRSRHHPLFRAIRAGKWGLGTTVRPAAIFLIGALHRQLNGTDIPEVRSGARRSGRRQALRPQSAAHKAWSENFSGAGKEPTAMVSVQHTAAPNRAATGRRPRSYGASVSHRGRRLHTFPEHASFAWQHRSARKAVVPR